MRSDRGFTLIELVISMVIIAVALAGVLMAINTSVFHSGDPMLSQQALAIGESYLEEILRKDFPKTPCPGGPRKNYRNICNYNGLIEAPTDLHGDPIPELSSYTVSVAVDTSNPVLGDLTSNTEVARVDVTVSHTGITAIMLSSYRANY